MAVTVSTCAIMVAFGIGHPCITFDKWALLMLVDDDWRVTGATRTFF
ncbi:hypothetical protein [Bosea thiooxidans]